jgi:predicted RNA-binding protein with RPS1 domain
MSKIKTTDVIEGVPGFDWDAISNSDNYYSPKEHTAITELYDDNIPDGFISKDTVIGETLEINKLVGISNDVITFSNGMVDIPIDLNQEKRFLDIYNTDIPGFKIWLAADNGKEFLSEPQYAEVEDTKNFRASLLKGFGFKVKQEFFAQIKSATKAYEAKVISKNKGGYIIDVFGVKGFLPGSLAAANIVKNFDEFVGTKVNVMVEDYLQNIETFVFSTKKYIKHILPSRIKELDLKTKYTGHITGASKFGIFIEINDFFTGLLHVTKMSKDTFEKFKAFEYQPGMELEVFIKEISKENKLVLTTFTPDEQKEFDDKMKKQRASKFASSISFTKEEEYDAEVLSVKPFGSFVSVTYGTKKVNAMILNDTSIERGGTAKVKFISQDKNKFFFKFS